MNREELNQAVEDLEAEREDLEFKLADIKGQLELAAAHKLETGEYSDIDWYRRAKAANRYAGIEHQRVLREIAALKKQLRQAERLALETAFVNVAREVLDTQTFNQLLHTAQQRTLP